VPTYEVDGWFDGSKDCEPPEPGKKWLTITEEGNEFCIIVVRVDPFDDAGDRDRALCAAEERALRITRGLALDQALTEIVRQEVNAT